MSLRALDLFSGIGGITHGLRGIVTPIAYVEKNEDAREFLKQKHPEIPVFEDVCTFDATGLKGKVDIITAGWPCTGFSTAGKGGGFSHHASGLFTEVVRLAKECDPKYLFLENSHVLSRKENLDVVVYAFSELGYDCRWVTCRATCVGAPHQRHRWFCIVSKRNVDLDIGIPHVEPFDWRSNEPGRQVEQITKEDRVKIGFLGNAVVPDQVRYAFSKILENVPMKITRASKVSNGCYINNAYYIRHITHSTREPLNIVMIPKEIPNRKIKCRLADIVKEQLVKSFWATPTHHNKKETKSRSILTIRQSKSLETQVGYADGGHFSWYLNFVWITWLMGYPKDYIA